LILGGTLLVAAGLKCHQLAFGFIPGITFFTSRWFLVATIESELVIGLILAMGLCRRYEAHISLPYFITLAVISGYMVASRVECCGCLDALAVSPWFTFSFNLSAICSLIYLSNRHVRYAPSWLALAASEVLFFGTSMFLAHVQIAALATNQDPSSLTGPDSQSRAVILDIENWSGRKLPILSETTIAPSLKEGKWLVLFVHPNCSKCSDAVNRLEEAANAFATRIAVVEIPLISENSKMARPSSSKLIWGELSRRHQWFVTTPVAIIMSEGVVVDVILDANKLLNPVTLASASGTLYVTRPRTFDGGVVGSRTSCGFTLKEVPTDVQEIMGDGQRVRGRHTRSQVQGVRHVFATQL